MTAVVSTSSPVTSVALVDEVGRVWSDRREAPRGSGGACLLMLEKLLRDAESDLSRIALWVADAGPGSFTGVKVGLMLAKTFAYARKVPVAKVSSFDLIAPDQSVSAASRKGEWFVRHPGQPPFATTDRSLAPSLGFGEGIEPPVFPDASRAAGLLSQLKREDPARLVPDYLTPPLISRPKTPHRPLGTP